MGFLFEIYLAMPDLAPLERDERQRRRGPSISELLEPADELFQCYSNISVRIIAFIADMSGLKVRLDLEKRG